MLEFGRENVHFAAVLKNHMVVHVSHGHFGTGFVGKLNECLPHLCFFKDEDFDDFAILAEKLIEVVVGDDVAIFVINADQEHRAIDFGVHGLGVIRVHIINITSPPVFAYNISLCDLFFGTKATLGAFTIFHGFYSGLFIFVFHLCWKKLK